MQQMLFIFYFLIAKNHYFKKAKRERERERVKDAKKTPLKKAYIIIFSQVIQYKVIQQNVNKKKFQLWQQLTTPGQGINFFKGKKKQVEEEEDEEERYTTLTTDNP